jgi:hypothetical protein
MGSRDKNAALRGHAVDTSPPDQDVDIRLELVEEGLKEADTDQRGASLRSIY